MKKCTTTEEKYREAERLWKRAFFFQIVACVLMLASLVMNILGI